MNCQSRYEKFQNYNQDDVKEAIEIMLGGMNYYYQYFKDGWPAPYENLNDIDKNNDVEKGNWNYRDDQNIQRNYIDDEIVVWLHFFSVLKIEDVNNYSLTSWSRNLIKSLKNDIKSANDDAERILWLVIREWRDFLVTLLYPYQEYETKISKNRLMYFNDKIRSVKTMMDKVPEWLSEEGHSDLKEIADREIQNQYLKYKLPYYLSEDKFPIYNPLSYLRDETYMKWKVINPIYKEDRLLNDKIFHINWLLDNSLKRTKISRINNTILSYYGIYEEKEGIDRSNIDAYRRYKTSKKKLNDKIRKRKRE